MTGTVWTGVEEAQARADHGAAQQRLSQRPVALIGFMGVGKTSVGRELARLLDRPFADTDAMVQQRAGATIPELFARGEATFRALERAAILAALDGPGQVLALGGGAFTQPGCPELLLPRALVVHLYTPWRVMRELLPELAAERPLIRDRPVHEVQQLFLSRAAAHRRAHVRICLPRRSPQRAAAEIVEVLRQHRREG
ncbi:MAG TPA: shikimate kinase [Actinoplanes sp.]|nr:shikimate kinase [Actinoplanes sp.]